MVQLTDTVNKIMKTHPESARAFERFGLDYCCGGGIRLDEAAQQRGVDPAALLAAIEDEIAPEAEPPDSPAQFSADRLADHIEETHHSWLMAEMPRLNAMTERVAMVHGNRDPRLHTIHETWSELFRELAEHLSKEEQILFPIIRGLARGEASAASHCGSVANPIAQMERDHDVIEAGIARLRDLTDGYVPPKWACGTYRAMLESLSRLEADTLAHTAKEETLLFPRAIELERAVKGG